MMWPRAILIAVATLLVANGAPASAAAEHDGARLYRRHCATCHGPNARGDGPDARYYEPRPRDLRDGVLARYETEALVRRIREGVPLALTPDMPAHEQRAKEVEAIAHHLERLPSVDWRRTDAGIEIYIDRCEQCHGPYGRAPATLPEGVRRPRDLSDPAWQKATADDALAAAIRSGHAAMPALVPRIEQEEAALVATFVRLLSPGFEQYSRYCAACHGDDGRGDGGFSEAPRRPMIGFDRKYFADRDPDEVRSAVWHMLSEKKPAMPHLRGTLTRDEARAIVGYLKGSD